MNGVKKFFKAILITILIAVIVGGVGYIGYSTLFGGHSGHNTAASQPAQPAAAPGTGQTVSGEQNSTGSQQASNDPAMANHTAASDANSNAAGSQPAAAGQLSNQAVAMNQSGTILKNKEDLEKVISKMNDSLQYLTLDPYAPAQDEMDKAMGNMQQQSAPGDTQAAGTPAVNAQGNTSINIYPQNNNTVNVVPPNTSNNAAPSAAPSAAVQPAITVQNMGTKYDPAKMEQLHSGLLKMAMGMQVLSQLNEQLTIQAEYANVNITDQIQYYTSQYNAAVDNRMKLSQAQNYILEASNLVNINPYVSADGLVYDQERMGMLHQGVYKLAEGMAAIDLLGDGFTKQSVQYANTAQNYINQALAAKNAAAQNAAVQSNAAANAAANQAAQANHAAMITTGGIFDNVNVQSIVNILLIVFVVGLILGILGFIFSLIKSHSRGQKPDVRPEETA